MKNLFSKKWFCLILFIMLCFCALQFIRPAIKNPVITADVTAADSVKMVLRSSCYNCHSNEVRLAWFDKITPASWLVAHDIREGRKVINFSEWDKVPKDRQKGILFEALNQIQFGTMPLHDYTFMHPDAKISTTEINIFKSCLSTLMVKPVADSSKTSAWNDQYQQWIQGVAGKTEIKPSLNGFIFNPGYKDWVVINSTVRTDNGTLKMIMGNDIAVKAIRNNHTNPWPDGTSFAKLTWIQTVDSAGNVCSGEFKQIAFMLKDAAKYRSTEGWGFSQWDKGLKLGTHGSTALFTTECVNCHKPMKAYDYVFTIPLQLTTLNALEDKLITSSADSKANTMSTLYGNDIAVNFARAPTGSEYPAGSALTLVTWKQKEDSRWFGGNIAGTIQQVEKISFTKTNNLAVEPVYEKYEGNSLTKIDGLIISDIKERIAFITNQRASVMP